MDLPPSPHRRCWAEIECAALHHNLAVARAKLAPGTRVMAVVKANAYGHGALPVGAALAGRVEMFGVANVGEARELRTVVPEPIFILGPALPEERAEIAAAGFIASVSCVAEARAFAACGGGRRVPIHLVIDTGMGRIGVDETNAVAVARAILAEPGVEITGIASHLPAADEDAAFTREQIAHFEQTVRALRALGLAQPIVHLDNSAGVLAFPGATGGMARPGLMLYGSSPIAEFQRLLRPALTWKTRITLIRDVPAGRGVSYGRTFITPTAMRLATLAVGYADGYPRHLSNAGAEVLIGGRRCPVLGRVTMDQIIVDISALQQAAAGDEVVLLGRQGDAEILAAELAAKAGTIAWEIFTGIGRRVERVHI